MRDREGGKKVEMKVVSHFLQPHGLYSPRNSPGHNIEVGSCSLSGDLSNPGIEPSSPALQADSLPAEPPGKPKEKCQEKRRERERGKKEEALKIMTKSLNFALKIMEESGKMNHF